MNNFISLSGAGPSETPKYESLLGYCAHEILSKLTVILDDKSSLDVEMAVAALAFFKYISALVASGSYRLGELSQTHNNPEKQIAAANAILLQSLAAISGIITDDRFYFSAV